MKTLVFYICTFVLVSFTIGSKLGGNNENYLSCLTETDVTDDDMLTIQEITENQLGNEEKERKNGCVMQCLFQKSGMMEESEFKVEKMQSEFTRKTNSQPEGKRFKALTKCIDETKDLPDKCQKSLALTTCFIKADNKMDSTIGTQPEEHHHNHEHEHDHEHEHEHENQ